MIISRSSSLFLAGLMLLFAGSVYSEDEYTGEIPPVEVGSPCVESVVYHWTTETKTEWKPTVLIAVPDGISPGEWEGTDAFVDAYHEMVEGNQQVSHMADALMVLWQQSLSRLYGEFERSVSVVSRQIQCSNGVWLMAGTSAATQTENSEWIGISDDAQDRSIVTAENLVQLLEAKLSYINSQPGADTRPHHSYTETAQ